MTIFPLKKYNKNLIVIREDVYSYVAKEYGLKLIDKKDYLSICEQQKLNNYEKTYR